MPAAGTPYRGRLAFDSDTGFHIDPDGNPLVTDGNGNYTYAGPDDVSHIERFHQNVAQIEGTTDPSLPGQSHHDWQSPPYLAAHPDQVAATATSHTDAPHETENPS